MAPNSSPVFDTTFWMCRKSNMYLQASRKESSRRHCCLLFLIHLERKLVEFMNANSKAASYVRGYLPNFDELDYENILPQWFSYYKFLVI